MFSAEDMLLILLVALLLFGSSKIPELARSLGKATGEFKKAQQETERELHDMATSPKEIKETKEDSSSKIRIMAHDLGIPTEGKNDNELLDEIQKKMIKIEKNT